MQYTTEAKDFHNALGITDERASELESLLHAVAENVSPGAENADDQIMEKFAPEIKTVEEAFYAGVAFTALCQVTGIID